MAYLHRPQNTLSTIILAISDDCLSKRAVTEEPYEFWRDLWANYLEPVEDTVDAFFTALHLVSMKDSVSFIQFAYRVSIMENSLTMFVNYIKELKKARTILRGFPSKHKYDSRPHSRIREEHKWINLNYSCQRGRVTVWCKQDYETLDGEITRVREYSEGLLFQLRKCWAFIAIFPRFGGKQKWQIGIWGSSLLLQETIRKPSQWQPRAILHILIICLNG